MLRFVGLRITSNDGAGFLDGLKASNKREALLDDLTSVELSSLSEPRELRDGRCAEENGLKREKEPLDWIASGCGDVSGSCLRSERADGKFLSLLRSVDIFLLEVGSVSTSLRAGDEDVLKLDIALCLPSCAEHLTVGQLEGG